MGRVTGPGVNAERIVTHREGGWIVTGSCGRPHLVGKGWGWWVCPVCRRAATRDRLTAEQTRRAALYYPEPR